MTSLEDRLDQDPEVWKPEPGDKIFGTLVGKDSRPSDYGSDYPLLEIETSEGTVYSVHCFHSVLKNEIERIRPRVGDSIGIRYDGKVPGKTNSYEKYRVVHQRGAGADVAVDKGSPEADAFDQVAATSSSEEEPF